MTTYRTLRLTETELGSLRSLVAITVETDADGAETSILERVLNKIDAPAKLCRTCQSTTHLECCVRCGRKVPKARRHTSFCTERCARAQRRDDRGSAIDEEQHCG